MDPPPAIPVWLIFVSIPCPAKLVWLMYLSTSCLTSVVDICIHTLLNQCGWLRESITLYYEHISNMVILPFPRGFRPHLAKYIQKEKLCLITLILYICMIILLWFIFTNNKNTRKNYFSWNDFFLSKEFICVNILIYLFISVKAKTVKICHSRRCFINNRILKQFLIEF